MLHFYPAKEIVHPAYGETANSELSRTAGSRSESLAGGAACLSVRRCGLPGSAACLAVMVLPRWSGITDKFGRSWLFPRTRPDAAGSMMPRLSESSWPGQDIHHDCYCQGSATRRPGPQPGSAAGRAQVASLSRGVACSLQVRNCQWAPSARLSRSGSIRPGPQHHAGKSQVPGPGRAARWRRSGSVPAEAFRDVTNRDGHVQCDGGLGGPNHAPDIPSCGRAARGPQKLDS